MDVVMIGFIINLSITVALLIYMMVTQYWVQKERESWIAERELLVKASMARDLTELSVSETMKTDKTVETDEIPEFTPLEEASDKQFDELISDQVGTEK